MRTSSPLFYPIKCSNFLVLYKVVWSYLAILVVVLPASFAQFFLYISSSFTPLSSIHKWCIAVSGLDSSIGRFRVHISLYFKASLRAKSLLWKSVFIHIEIRTTYWDWLWERDYGELGNGLLKSIFNAFKPLLFSQWRNQERKHVQEHWS